MDSSFLFYCAIGIIVVGAAGFFLWRKFFRRQRKPVTIPKFSHTVRHDREEQMPPPSPPDAQNTAAVVSWLESINFNLVEIHKRLAGRLPNQAPPTLDLITLLSSIEARLSFIEKSLKTTAGRTTLEEQTVSHPQHSPSAKLADPATVVGQVFAKFCREEPQPHNGTALEARLRRELQRSDLQLGLVFRDENDKGSPLLAESGRTFINPVRYWRLDVAGRTLILPMPVSNLQFHEVAPEVFCYIGDGTCIVNKTQEVEPAEAEGSKNFWKIIKPGKIVSRSSQKSEPAAHALASSRPKGGVASQPPSTSIEMLKPKLAPGEKSPTAPGLDRNSPGTPTSLALEEARQTALEEPNPDDQAAKIHQWRLTVGSAWQQFLSKSCRLDNLQWIPGVVDQTNAATEFKHSFLKALQEADPNMPSDSVEVYILRPRPDKDHGDTLAFIVDGDHEWRQKPLASWCVLVKWEGGCGYFLVPAPMASKTVGGLSGFGISGEMNLSEIQDLRPGRLSFDAASDLYFLKPEDRGEIVQTQQGA